MAVQLEKKYLVDTQDKSVGVVLPLTKGNNGYFDVSYDTKTQIKTNLKNLLLTQKGERLMQPDFGSDLKKLVFEPLSANILESKLESTINDAINKWMPYVNVDEIVYNVNEDNYNIELELKYSLKYSNAETLEQINIII